MKKKLSAKDLVFINVVAILGIRWLPIAAGYGASSIAMWSLAAVLFLIPLGLVSTELATTWPEQGGMYVWTKHAFGEKPAFIVSWFYWINSFFYYPALLTFIAVTAAYLINPALATNKFFVSSVVIIGLWLITILNCKDISFLKWIAKYGGIFGILLPGIMIILLGIGTVIFFGHNIPTDYSLKAWIPNFSSEANIVFLSTLMFSMSGMEITTILAGDVENPQKNYPKALFLSALLIVFIYVLGTVSITFMISPDKIGAASGIMDAVAIITNKYHLHFILWLVGGLIIFGTIGGVSVWIVVPIKMLFESTKKGILPNFLIKLNDHGMPTNAMLIQAAIISFIVLGTSFLPSVNAFYETLVLMATITYFIPYLFMFLALIKLRKIFPEKKRPYKIPGKSFPKIIALIGFFSVLIGIILPFVFPPADMKNHGAIYIYEAELFLGVIIFYVIGALIFRMRK